MVANRKEAYIQALIRDYLELHGWIVLITDAGEVARATRQAHRRGRLKPGTPDIIALKGGRGIAIECKRTQGGRTSQGQRLEHERYRLAGVPVAVVTSLDELKKWLSVLET